MPSLAVPFGSSTVTCDTVSTLLKLPLKSARIGSTSTRSTVGNVSTVTLSLFAQLLFSVGKSVMGTAGVVSGCDRLHTAPATFLYVQALDACVLLTMNS